MLRWQINILNKYICESSHVLSILAFKQIKLYLFDLKEKK